MKPLLLLGGAALVVAVVSVSSKRKPKTNKACPPPGTRVLLLGDSNAVGLGGTAFGARAPMVGLAKDCSTVFAAEVKGGTGAPYWASRISEILQAHAPTVVLVNLGANDYNRTDPEHVKESIGLLVDAIRSSGAKLIWISPPADMGPPIRVDKIGVLDMWREHDLTEFRVADHADLNPLRAPDQIHFTLEGYEELAKRVWIFMSNSV